MAQMPSNGSNAIKWPKCHQMAQIPSNGSNTIKWLKCRLAPRARPAAARPARHAGARVVGCWRRARGGRGGGARVGGRGALRGADDGPRRPPQMAQMPPRPAALRHLSRWGRAGQSRGVPRGGAAAGAGGDPRGRAVRGRGRAAHQRCGGHVRGGAPQAPEPLPQERAGHAGGGGSRGAGAERGGVGSALGGLAEVITPPPPPPPLRTNRTRRVLHPVLIGHACRDRSGATWRSTPTCASRPAPPPPPFLVLSGHAASLTPYLSDTPRPSPRTDRTRRVPHPVLIGHAACASRPPRPGSGRLAPRPAPARPAPSSPAPACM